jgi:acyl carrier protein
LHHLLNQSQPQIAVIPIQWKQFLQQALPTRFADNFKHVSDTQQAGTHQSTILEDLTTAADQTKLLEDYLRSQVAQVLGFKPEEIDPGKGFFDLGMDSLTSVELKSRLQRDLGGSLPATIAFDYPTITALAQFLLEQLTEPPTPDLSEQEIAALLAQELDLR